MTLVDRRLELEWGARSEHPTCPKCLSAEGYSAEFHEGGFGDFLLGNVWGCHGQAAHYDIRCRNCYKIVGKAPVVK